MANLCRLPSSSGGLSWLRSDSQIQVTTNYSTLMDGSLKLPKVDTVVISVQHVGEITTEELRERVMKEERYGNFIAW
jgi:S-adenosylmethionine synthetase